MRDERLEDALQYINELLELLRNYTTTNDTPEGRTKHMLYWYKQEIEAGRLTQLPLPEEQTSTIRHVYCENYLKHVDIPRQKRLDKLISILDEGHFLMKPQFYPLVIEEIDKMRALLAGNGANNGNTSVEGLNELCNAAHDKLTPTQKNSILGLLLRDLSLLRTRFADGTIEPPPADWNNYIGAKLVTEKLIFGGHGSKTPEEKQWARLRLLIFEGLRPDPEGKIRNRRW